MRSVASSRRRSLGAADGLIQRNGPVRIFVLDGSAEPIGMNNFIKRDVLGWGLFCG
jgi:hypothetical protein